MFVAAAALRSQSRGAPTSANLLAELKISLRSNFAALRLAIEYVAPRRVWSKRRRTREHGQAQVRRLADHIRRHGFLVPLVVDDQLALVAGQARLDAVELLKLGYRARRSIARLIPPFA